MLTTESILLSKTAMQIEADHKELLDTIKGLEKFSGRASQELLQKSDDISKALQLFSNQVIANSARLKRIHDGVEEVQTALKKRKRLSSKNSQYLHPIRLN